MTTRSPRCRLVVVTVAGLALGAGCAAPSGGDGGPRTEVRAGAVTSAAAPAIALRKGMKPEEVRALLGEPAHITPVRFSEGEAETWVYERGSESEVRQAVTGTQEVPYFDPFLNQIRMIPEPVYSQETITVVEELHVVWHHGELREWRTEYRTKRAYVQ